MNINTHVWTVAEVRDELPDIRGKFADGTTIPIRIGGRLREDGDGKPYRYATLYTSIHGSNLTIGEAAWTTIVHCINTNTPLDL